MGENATEGFFIGTYIFVFVIALGATITMFTMVNDYAEISYEYGKNVETSGTMIEVNSTETARLVTGDQIISYYFNYIALEGSNYDITIYNSVTDGDNVNYTKIDLNPTYSGESLYSNLLGKIKLNQIYQLKYEKYDVRTNKAYIGIYPYNPNI